MRCSIHVAMIYLSGLLWILGLNLFMNAIPKKHLEKLFRWVSLILSHWLTQKNITERHRNQCGPESPETTATLLQWVPSVITHSHSLHFHSTILLDLVFSVG
ncbi:hypothetical protein Csa_022024, partial [Cucumis sativus]